MSCQGCFNGCVETTSDQCVKYTGPYIEFLGISTGDPLALVESKITTYLQTVLNGTGIVPDIDLATNACIAISAYLPSEGDITLNDLLLALVKGTCDISSSNTAMLNFVDALEGDYDIGDCIAGIVDATSGTHAILQAVIDSLCQMALDLEDMAADLATNYEKKADLNDDIAAYMAGTTSSRYYNRMIPYTAVEYYGSLSHFDPSGAGIPNTDWEKIYLCNGQNGTPDKRGFSPVGAIVNAGNNALDPIVDGLTPVYATGTSYGAAMVALTEATMPAHTHTATATDSGHNHLTVKVNDGGSNISPINSNVPIKEADTANYTLYGLTGTANAGKTSDGQANISISIASKGGSESHTNIPPVLACLYVMYIP